jgi:hypothetical protein
MRAARYACCTVVGVFASEGGRAANLSRSKTGHTLISCATYMILERLNKLVLTWTLP